MAVADLAKTLPVAGGRDDRAARVLDRLHDDHRDRLRLLELDHLLDLVEERLREGGLVATSRGMPVGVRGRDVGGRDRERLEGGAADRDPGEGECAEGNAVVGVAAGDHLAAGGLAVRLVPLDGHLVGGLDRLRSTGGEERALEAVRRQLGELRRQLDRRRVSDGPVRRVGERRHLRRRLGAKLLAVRVAEVEAVEAREAVDVAVAVVVVDVGALAAHDHGDVLRGRRVMSEKCSIRCCLASS